MLSRSTRPLLMCFSLRLNESQQCTVRRGRRDTDGGTTADTGAADRRLRLGEIGCRNHEAGAAALGQSRQRHFGITPAQLFLREEYEIGAIRTGWHRDCAVRFGLEVAIDQAREVRGVFCGL